MGAPDGIVMVKSPRPSGEAPSAGSNGPGGNPTDSAERSDSRRTLRQLKEVLDREGYSAALLLAYRTSFNGTVRAYGLDVPISCSDRRFLKELLQPDMGPLTTLLPELYRRYEPVKFGRPAEGDREALRALLERLFSETVLAHLDDPGFQPSGPLATGERTSRYDRLVRSLPQRQT
ncbi:MAG TPA: hypothetical protein VMH38_03875 [Thermoplasmata archaeon]|nr:hypothetical protein [Thermoplasmata archaeon]